MGDDCAHGARRAVVCGNPHEGPLRRAGWARLVAVVSVWGRIILSSLMPLECLTGRTPLFAPLEEGFFRPATVPSTGSRPGGHRSVRRGR